VRSELPHACITRHSVMPAPTQTGNSMTAMMNFIHFGTVGLF
jgi:hypothetical protein